MKTFLRMNSSKSGQFGFTLLELLVAMVIGLIILSAVLGLFVSMVQSDSDSIKMAQLNQELRGVMSLITRDIRRAGANRNSAADATGATPSNPFSVAGGTRLTISANEQGDPDSCITYSYDSDEGNELYGFRWDSNVHTIETRTAGAACNAGGWTGITDENQTYITALAFTDNTVVEAGINIREIAITLSGRLVKDANVSRTLTETIKIRNDEF